MRNNRVNNKLNIVVLSVCVIVTMIVASLSISKAWGIFFPQDEFGYWNNAARIVGIDWSEVAKGQISYAYGYSMLLVPLMGMVKNPVIMYRIALGLNSGLVILYLMLYFRLAGWILEEYGTSSVDCGGLKTSGLGSIWEDGRGRACNSVVIAVSFLYPSTLVYMNYTISETLISLLFMILSLMVYRMYKDGLGLGRFLVGLIVGVMLFLVHYRTVGVLIAYLFVCIRMYCGEKGSRSLENRENIKDGACGKDRGKSLGIVVITLLVAMLLFIVVMIIARLTRVDVFGKLTDVNRLLQFVLGICGKFYYLSVASLGMGLIGLAIAIKRRKVFYEYLILSFVMTTVISAYFFVGGRCIDQIVYGRYIEFMMPLFICLGLKYVSKVKVGSRGELARVSSEVQCGVMPFVYATIILGIMAIIFTLFVQRMGMSELLTNFIPGISWMYGNVMPSVSMVFERPFYIATVVGVVILLMRRFLTRLEVLPVVLVGVIFLFAGMFVIKKDVYINQANGEMDYRLSQRIEELEEEGRELIFLDSPFSNYVNLMQFWLKDETIHVIGGLDEDAYNTPEDAVILTHANYEGFEQLRERYEMIEYSPHFYIYYNSVE